MAFPSTPILDDFNRADETPLRFGGLWYSTVELGTGSLALVSNAAKNNTGFPVVKGRVWLPIAAADQECYLTAVDSTARYSIAVRISNPGTAQLSCWFVDFNADATGADVYTVVNNSFNFFATKAMTRANNDVLGLSVIGTTLTVWQNGVSRGTQTDGTITGRGQIGFEIKAQPFTALNFGGGPFDEVRGPDPMIRR